MHPKHFIKQLDDAKVVDAIAEAEGKTSGEIRVFVSRKPCADALVEAQRCFLKSNMHQTKHRNAVLIYFAPQAQKFAIWGDSGVHEKCGDQFWEGIAEAISPLLKAGQFTEAVIEAVRLIGEMLKKHFPHETDDKDELPNSILRD